MESQYNATFHQTVFKSIIKTAVANIFINNIFIPFLHAHNTVNNPPMLITINVNVTMNVTEEEDMELDDGESLSIPSDWEE